VLRILHVETGTNLYGGALQVYYLLRGLQKKDCFNILVCPERSDIGHEADSSVDKNYQIPMHGDLDLLFIFRLWKIIKQEKPDIVHLHSRRGADILGGIAARLARVPAVLTRRVDNPEPALLVKIKYRLYKKVITISQGIKQVLLSEGVEPRKLQCIHSAVDIKKYKMGCTDKAIRSQLGLDENDKAVAVIAQLIDRKGHRYLIRAIPEIIKHVPQAKFILFGKGPLEQSLRELCLQTGIFDSVIFAGFRNDLEKILPCLNLVAHPADMEGLGVSLLQAAACGLPIVATPVGGIPEIVRDGINGFLVDPGDSAQLASKIIELLENNTLADQYGTAGRKLVEQYFSIDAMVNANFSMYQKLVL